MADSLTDLISAIDTYMASNAKSKTAGPYLATKVSAVFDDPDSIFNPKGVLKTLSTKLGETFTELRTELNIFQKSINDINKKSIGTIFNKSVKTLEHFNLNIAKFNTKLFDASKTVPKTTTAFQLPQTINTQPKKEETLVGKKVVDVRLVGIDDNIKSYLSKVITSNQKPVKSFFSSVGDTIKSVSAGAKGFIGKIWDWLWFIGKTVLFTIGGLYLLGKLKQFLNDTPLGQSIKSNIVKFSTYLFDKITTFLKSDELKNGVKMGITLISDTLRSIWKGISDAWTNNKDRIGKMADSVWNFSRDEIWYPFYNKVLMPIFDGIGNKLATMDWSNTMGDIGKWIKDKIIKPIYENIAKDFENNDAGEGWAKILGIGALSALLIGPTGLVFLLGTTVVAFKSLISVLGVAGVGGVGLLATLAVFGTVLYKLNNAANDIALNMQKQADSTKKALAPKEGYVTKHLNNATTQSQRSQLLADATTTGGQLRGELARASTELEKQLALNQAHEIEYTKRKLELQQYIAANGGFGWSQDMVGSLIKSRQLAKLEKEEQKRSNDILEKSIIPLRKTINNIEKDINEVNIQTKNPYIFPKPVKPLDSSAEKYPEFFPKKRKNLVEVNDAVIVEPHSKDQILMGKKGGPFDLASKESLMKLDTLTQVFAEGVAMIMQASMQGSQQIVGAISASGQSASQATTGGGIDHIGAYRMRAEQAIKGAMR